MRFLLYGNEVSTLVACISALEVVTNRRYFALGVIPTTGIPRKSDTSKPAATETSNP
jgi:hypothetical protein